MTEPARPLSSVLSERGATRPQSPSHPHGVVPLSDSTGEIVTSVDLIAKLDALYEELDEAHADVTRLAQEAIEAEHAYELAYSTARIMSEREEGSVEYKKQRAVQAASEKKRAWGDAKEVLRSARRAEEIVSQKLSALQTIANHARDEMRLAGQLSTNRTG